MKINKFFALAAIAMLVVGTMSVISNKAFAQDNQPPAVIDCNDQADDAAEVEALEAEDTDDVEEQCGPQDEELDGAEEADTDQVENEFEDVDEAGEIEGVDEAEEVEPAGTGFSRMDSALF